MRNRGSTTKAAREWMAAGAVTAILGLVATGCGMPFSTVQRPTVVEWGDAHGLMARRVVQGNGLRGPNESAPGPENVGAWCWCQSGAEMLAGTRAQRPLPPAHSHWTPPAGPARGKSSLLDAEGFERIPAVATLGLYGACCALGMLGYGMGTFR